MSQQLTNDVLQGVVKLYATGAFNDALNSLEILISQFPNSAILHNIKGATLRGLGKTNEALTSYSEAIRIDPNYADGYNNKGVLLGELGLLEEAKDAYQKAIELRPDYAEAHNNLVSLFQYRDFDNHKSLNLIDLSHKVRCRYDKFTKKNSHLDCDIIEFLKDSFELIKTSELRLHIPQSQFFRSTNTDLKCDRHMRVFNQLNVIPQACFGCYKVQINAERVLDLIKLCTFLDTSSILVGKIKKCMIELRPYVSGKYKGFVYCSSLKEANDLANELKIQISARLHTGFTIIVKRGCTEFTDSFPEYGRLPNGSSYNQSWSELENGFDKVNPFYFDRFVNAHLPGISLFDVLIFQKWIDYAQGVSDQSVYAFANQEIQYRDVYELACNRASNES